MRHTRRRGGSPVLGRRAGRARTRDHPNVLGSHGTHRRTFRRPMTVALVHDYLTQRGGAERVVLALTRAFPDAPALHVALRSGRHVPRVPSVDVRPLPINRLAPLRTHHRAALPLLASSFSRLRVSADVVICSSSGWAHGAHVEGRKIVYCHTPARWLYQSDRYLRGRGRASVLVPGCSSRALERWDKNAAASADAYLANSTVVAERIRSIYGIDAEVVPPPPAITPDGPSDAISGLEPGFLLCVSRLMPYKNVDVVVEAASVASQTSDSSSPAPARLSRASASGYLERHVHGHRHGRSTPLAVRELPSAHRSLVRRLRTDTVRSRELRQTNCGSPLGRLPRHDRGGTHRDLFRPAHNTCGHRGDPGTWSNRMARKRNSGVCDPVLGGTLHRACHRNCRTQLKHL